MKQEISEDIDERPVEIVQKAKHITRPRAAIDTAQSSTGVVDAADVLVNIEKDQALAPQEKRYTNVCVLATKKTGGADHVGTLITDKKSVENDIEELAELNFVGVVRVWNTALTADVITAMQGYAESVVVLSGRTADTNGQDFGDMVVWLTETAAQTSLDSIVDLPNRGVMIDPGKQGKLLYALTSLLQNGSIKYTNQIINSSFTGVVDPGIATALDNVGYSYWFCAKDKIWLRGFWIGKQQARSEYADRSVRYDVKQTVASVVASGMNYTNDNLALIEARILQALKDNSFVSNVLSVSVPRNQKPSDKVRGMVMGVTVKFETANEVRTVFVNLGGNV